MTTQVTTAMTIHALQIERLSNEIETRTSDEPLNEREVTKLVEIMLDITDAMRTVQVAIARAVLQ